MIIGFDVDRVRRWMDMRRFIWFMLKKKSHSFRYSKGLDMLSELECLTLKVKSNQGEVGRVRKLVVGDENQWYSSYLKCARP